MIKAWAARTPKGKLEKFDFDPGPLKGDEVEIAVEHCGICHSDLSVIDNEWGVSSYPAVPGHEVIGQVVALGTETRGLRVGQRVGLGWTAGSCLHCHECLSGDQHLCAESVATIVGHAGGFANRVRAQWPWVIHLPEGLDPREAGPLLCGGVTVFSPLQTYGIKPTDKVGIVGIGGLGHLAVKFAAAWGCEVTAFTSSASKEAEARGFGAHRVVNSKDPAAIAAIAGSLDLVIVTVNVPLDWKALLATLRPKGRLHFVGAVLEPVPIEAFALISGQRSVSGSPTGSPVTIASMLEFAARHKILPQTEHFPIAQVNEALDHLRAGKARYRVILDM
ncbi:NADPH-dependent aldehyde reductase Ahr [Beijerinckia indica]|uniref:alcohol dehydrogenase (NADP(+)) n=1 Tax=Beijerinckia indica subsp. indica (strain ATCC 9039 / DSM 1715 / NCIMB 8712) TaxID=395963 RepID=B2IJ23_BEII9|nr:NAD(P)-dependent alcohol dehydrogenase [Beijerinckia indica]ACB94786.1 Alcohol dehydrogenase zinc-binding domain protein [Beijerinckia indica subsp. indica ATCC 9039]